MPTKAQLQDEIRAAQAVGDEARVRELSIRVLRGDYDQEPTATAEPEAAETEQPEQINDVLSTLRGGAQGAGFGFADEVGAGLSTLLVDPVAAAFTDEDMGGIRGYLDSFGERYSRNLQEQRGFDKQAREEDPYLYTGGEFAGGFAVPGGATAKAVQGMGKLRGGMRAAGMGAGMGTAAGYGYSEADPLATAAGSLFSEEENPAVFNEFMQAATDAGIGASVGGTMGVVLPAAGAGVRSVARRVSTMFRKNKEKVLTEKVRRDIAEAIEEDIRAGNYNSWKDVEAEINAIPGMTVADIGPATRAIADKLANINVEGGNKLLTFLRGRNREQFARFDDKLKSLIGDDNFARASKAAAERTRTQAADAYGQAYGQMVQVTDDMEKIIHSHWGKRALGDINDLRAQEKLPLYGRHQKTSQKAGDIITTRDPATGMPVISRAAEDVTEMVNLPKAGDMIDVRDLDTIVRGWDGLVSGAYKDVKPQASDMKRYRDLLREMIYDASPAYRDARSVFRSLRQDEEALEMGTKLFRTDQDVWMDVLDGMSESEKTMFRIGALRAIKNRLKKKPDDADIAKGVMNNPYNREAIRLAFPDQRAWDDFVRFVSDESRMFDTFSQVAGNSKTAKRLMEIAGANDPGSQLAALSGYALGLSAGGGIPPSISGFLAKRAYQGMADPAGRVARMVQNTSNRQADMLMQGANGPANLSQIMEPQMMQRLLSTDIPLLPVRAAGGATQGILGPAADERNRLE